MLEKYDYLNEEHEAFTKDKEPHVYKYVNSDIAKKMLTRKEIKFSTPAALNDPFDLNKIRIYGFDSFSPDSMRLVSQEIRNILYSSEKLPPFNDTEIARRIEWARAELTKCSPEELAAYKVKADEVPTENLWNIDSLKKQAEYFKTQMENLLSWDVVFCGSRDFNNMSLWDRYADGHRGAVLQFVPHIKADSQLRLLTAVKYSDKRPVLFKSVQEHVEKGLFQNQVKMMENFKAEHCHTKATSWSYEKELRVFIPNVGGKYRFEFYHYLPSELKTVYLGYKMPTEQKDFISNLAVRVNPWVDVYEMLEDDTGDGYELAHRDITPNKVKA